MNPLAALAHPRRAFIAAAAAPRPAAAFAAVLLSGLVSFALGAAANALGGGSASGLVVAASLPALFAAYWVLEAWLVDAGARMLGRAGRRRTYLATSGYAFPAWIAYAVLSLAEALSLRLAGGAGATLASALAWLTLPVLGWFVVLSVLAIIAVYGVPALNALALALLPYAVLTAALLVIGLTLSALHAGGVV